jgi:hypothetical protein
VLVFPTDGDSQEWPLLESKVQEYFESFPNLDVLAECRKALQWIRDNPTNRKTGKGMTRFLNNWLNNAQNRRPGFARHGPTHGHTVATATAQAAAEYFREKGVIV